MSKAARLALKWVAGVLWVYSYVTLGAMMAIAALPGFLVAKWAWNVNVTWPNATWATALDALLGVYFSIMAFFIFGIALMFVLPLMKFIFHWKPHTGTISIQSFKIWPWYNYNGMLFMFNTVFGRFARATTLYPVYLRMMGATIGKRSVVNTQHLYDLDILEIGDDTVIGANASILGHVGEKGTLVRAPIKIGNKCTVGQYTSVFPGVTMEDNCHVGAMSLVPKGTYLKGNAVYGGIPVRKIKDLQPGTTADADDVSATTGGKPE
jgi:acetyltransferase-like isoleucine patch superfamily enzyme